LNSLRKQINKIMYCQNQIEDNGVCTTQCEHCKKYYAPLELEQSKKYPIGGFAPGNYLNNCVTCKQRFTGDKRAVQCEPCAIKTMKEESKQKTRVFGTKEDKSFWSNKPIQDENSNKQETLEESIYQAIGLSANEQGIINQALATSKVMSVISERMYSEDDLRKAIQLARLCTLDGQTADFVCLAGLTEVCTYSLEETYSENEIIEQFKKDK